MAEWARVDDVAEPWKARWEEAERRFFGYDEYLLDRSLDGLTIWPLAPGDLERRNFGGEVVVSEGEVRVGDTTIWPFTTGVPAKREAGGKVVVSEREIRVGDSKFQSVIDVRRGRSPWPRDVLRHETEHIGTIRRRRGWGGRPSWSIVDQDCGVVATLREPSLGAAAGRHALSVAGTIAEGVITLGNSSGYREPRSDFVVSAANRKLGEIRGGRHLDLTGDPGRELDRRLAVAAFVSILLAEEGH